MPFQTGIEKVTDCFNIICITVIKSNTQLYFKKPLFFFSVYTIYNNNVILLFQVLCTLRFMAKADFFSEVGDIHGISKSSVCVFLPRVCRALNAFLHIDFPTDAQTLLKMKEGFYAIAHFPNVVGAIDGTLIPIRGMNGEDEPVYVCRKNFHALNVQGVVDANMRYILA